MSVAITKLWLAGVWLSMRAVGGWMVGWLDGAGTNGVCCLACVAARNYIKATSSPANVFNWVRKRSRCHRKKYNATASWERPKGGEKLGQKIVTSQIEKLIARKIKKARACSSRSECPCPNVDCQLQRIKKLQIVIELEAKIIKCSEKL